MLLSDLGPTLVCLQETYHRSDKLANFSNYSFYCRTADEVNGILHGGVGILVKNGIPHKLCQFNTNIRVEHTWNIRGLQANREELSILLSDFDPTLVCLQ